MRFDWHTELVAKATLLRLLLPLLTLWMWKEDYPRR